MNIYPTIWTNFYEDHLDKEVNQAASTPKSNIELPPRNLSQRWRRYGNDAKRRVFERFSKWCPKGTATSNLFIYLKTDQTFPEFVLKSVIGFFGGIALTYLCFVFFVFQLSISLIHATIMSSIIGVLLTFGLAFSYRIRCLVFLLIPQLFSRVGRYTLTCYALVLILTGPATNTLKNSEVLTESMACTQEQIKTDVKQITDSVKKPFSSMRDAIKLMIKRLNEISNKVDVILTKINRLVRTIVDVIQSSYLWLYSVIEKCNDRFGTPYNHCVKVLTYDAGNEKHKQQRILRNNSFMAKTLCSAVIFNKQVCIAPDYLEESIAATIKRKLRTFTNRVKAMFLIRLHMHHSYTFTSNSSRSPSQVTAGIVTEIRNRADPLLTWLSWSSCITSLFLLLIIFRAKNYQQMFETRSRFDNRYITKELRDLDLQRSQEGKDTVLPLNRRERAKYVTTTSLRLVATEKINLTRSVVFMTITSFKLMIHMIADYSLYWVLTIIRYHGKRQTMLPPGPMDAGLIITGTGLIADLIRAIFKALLSPLLESPASISCLPNPYPPDLTRYAQIGVLIFLLWFFALFEPYGLRLRHLIMGHYRPERAKARAAWLYNHILRTRGSFMKSARRKLHKEFKHLPQEELTFRHWLRTLIPCRWLRCILGITPIEAKCLLCYAKEVKNVPSSVLIRCESENCPGKYCNGCYTDIGRLCTICLSPVDYGDFSDISLEKGSSEDSEDSSRSESDKTKLLPKRKYFTKSRDSHESENVIGYMKKCNPKKPRFYSSNQVNENHDKTPLLYPTNEELQDNIYSSYQFINSETLGFTKSVLKNNITVGYVYHNYFCENNLVNVSPKIFKRYHDMGKDILLNLPSKHVQYGSIENPLDKIHTETPKFNETKLSQKEPTSPKEKNIISETANNIGINNNTKTYSMTKKRKRRRKISRSKSISYLKTIKNKLSQNINYKRKNRRTFNRMKRNLSNTVCNVKSSLTRIVDGLGHRNISLNVYNIKKRPSAIAVSKISVKRKVKHRRKNIRILQANNDSQKDKRCINNANNNQLHEKNNKSETGNSSPLKTGNELSNDHDKLNINDKNKKIRKADSKTLHLKNCLSIRKVRKLIPNIMVIRILNKICYAKKSKVKYKHNYKCRKKVHNMIKSSTTNKSTWNDTEISRNYRIYRFLNEGGWTKSRFEEEILDPSPENNEKTSDNAVDYCEKVRIEESTKKPISKCNKHLSCNCIINKSIDDRKEDNKWKKESVYKTHLPIMFGSHSGRGLGKSSLDHFKTSSVKSFSLNNVKLYIANKFLHLKFGKPITVLRALISTLALAKDKVSAPESILRDHKNTAVDEGVTAMPIVKTNSCQWQNDNDITSQRTSLQVLHNSPQPISEENDDKQTQTEIKYCTCASQYMKGDVKKNVSDRFIHDLFKGVDKVEARNDVKSFTSDSTRTDTTLCSCVALDFKEEKPKSKVKNKRGAKKEKVITKSNQSTATDITSFRNASTVTSDWWSPIVERKEMDFKRGDHVLKRKREARLVTFRSRTQLIPHEESYILSPSRYLLESQKYYNELFSPTRFYAPHLFSVNRANRDKVDNVCANRRNKNHKTKRLDQRRSSKTSPRGIVTRSDETFSFNFGGN